MTTLGKLAAASGSSLVAMGPFDPARRVSAVHVSELADPSRYLDGGELLLTTGLPLTGGDTDVAYLGRLRESGVSALGLGLGEGWDTTPPGLADLCDEAGIALFIVPDNEPFLRVTRAFWQLEGRDERDAVVRVAHAHTRLAQAASGADAVPAMVGQIARAVSGWAAWIALDAHAPESVLHPAKLQGMLPTVAVEIGSALERAGVAAASFISHKSVVVAHPIAENGRTLGALVVGAERALSPADRNLTLTAVALLRLAIVPRSSGDGGVGRWVAALAVRGDARSARALAGVAGAALPPTVRVLVTDAVSPLVDEDFAVDHDGVRVTLVVDGASPLPHRGVLSAVVALEDVPEAAGRAMVLFTNSSSDTLVVEPHDRAVRWVELLAATPPLLQTVREYLREGRRIDATARALGVHRNTVRQRVGAADMLLGIELSHPDASAELWLALRRWAGRCVNSD